MRLPLAALLAASLLLAAPVQAEEAGPITRQGVADDEVVMMLEVEDWVETTTATVRISADLAVEAGTFGAARDELVSTLQGFGIDTTWRIVQFSKQADDAGFERWSVTAEARLPEAALSDLSAKAKGATKPGRSLTVASIDYSPTMAEREAVTDSLRTRVYERVGKEIAALNAAFADRSFRVRMIDFTQSYRPVPMAKAEMQMMRSDMPQSASGGGSGLAGAEKASITARVHLAATAPAAQ
ncbi:MULTISPECIES: hypothetical protein [Thalassobaculum]|uniref:DUF541 domain-containing protein n=1 Tax=Thalassobaculum litoreum DSM 18839 TaxID=1123362 RepID=A0A8G2BK53_9PROT|nr:MULTISPECIES: hypothetical protein [Thalassobaculum]SDG08114.1 hypothetical protein SAMN05660686_03276 [Thalassobaculum litoreum DSM 18839]